jgi:levanase
MFFLHHCLPLPSFLPAISLLWFISLANAAPDVVLADFEGGTYGAWTRSGTAPGTAPASGTLANHGTVTGFLGSGLVNTYLGGDATTGTLTSPAFTISCRYLCFLIGGGYFRSTRLDLSIDGQVVRTASGTNAGGGNEQLLWRSWDLQEFAGRAAMLKVTDQGTGGWGHINLDQIMLSDTPRGTIQTLSELPLIISRPYLNMRLATARRTPHAPAPARGHCRRLGNSGL